MNAFSYLKSSSTAAAFLSLVACASVNPIGLAKLAALDPLSADPAQIKVAARLPEALKLRTGDLIMVIKTNDLEDANKIDQTFYLEVNDAKAGDAGVIIPEDYERLQTARIAPQDIDRLRAAQAKAKALKAMGGSKGTGSMTVAIKGGCKASEPANAPLTMNLYMTTESAGDWFPVVSNFDLRKQLGDELIAKIEPCQ
jgi:hypothetical protein